MAERLLKEGGTLETVGGFVVRSEQLKGMRLGGYEIARLIGHGATASVFEATHVALGKPVAVKILHEHLASDEQLLNRFLREGRVAARLRHPNTVDVIDVGVESGVPYLVMELLGGIDLRTLLAEAHLLGLEQALEYLLPICSALAQAHDAGVIHRDLKPANIFLARDMRGDVIPKLVDFGLSKVENGDAISSLTATELVAGTALYMAPEQTLGIKNSSPASDQYSLASILYECVAGATPFSADGVYALLDKIRTDIVRPPSHLNPRLSEELDAVLLRALNRDPVRRFSSVRAFARALLPFASPETGRALERDFLDRASAKTATAAVRPSVRKTVAEAETRGEPLPSDPAVAASGVHLIPPLPCPPGTSPFHIKGMSYRGFVYLLSQLLPRGLDAFCEALPDKALTAFVRQQFLASGRYDILPFLPLYATLARLLGVPFEGLVRESAAAQARYDAHTVFTTMWTNATMANVAERITRLGGQYYDFGTYTASLPGPTSLLIEHVGVPAYVYPWYGPMQRAYTEASLQMLGAMDVTVAVQEGVPAGTQAGFPLLATKAEIRWRAAEQS